ncbi:MAG TPA: extracellular solute-binding protein [Beijerinckiaceae bacterium]|nr:extracellular solute-binding protein [Beijerinckiaceae bacterium]
MLVHAPVFAADQALIDAAKKEGEVVWYTTQIIDQLIRPVAQAFEKKYGIKTTFLRADSNSVALRVINEGRAGQMHGDVFDGQSAAATLKKQGFVLQWIPDSAARLPKQYVDPEGYWAATNLLVVEPGFNTNLVPKGTEPKTWNDLLDPKWKGKMAWNSNPGGSTGPSFVGLVLKELGEEKGMTYLRQLAKQDIVGLSSGAHDVLDQVIAGEYALGLQMLNNQVVFSTRQGAPVDWIAMQPALVIMSGISVIKGAPHPNAGKLLVDFTLSEEGQKLYRDADYIAVDPKVELRDPSVRPDGVKFRAIYMTPEELDQSMGQWKKIFDGLFR